MAKVVRSLDVELVELDGVWYAYAPWLADPVKAKTADAALWGALHPGVK